MQDRRQRAFRIAEPFEQGRDPLQAQYVAAWREQGQPIELTPKTLEDSLRLVMRTHGLFALYDLAAHMCHPDDGLYPWVSPWGSR